MPPSGKKARGCDNCRRSHLKCDGQEPCARCLRKRLPCGRNFRVRFRIYEQSNQFTNSQHWVRTSGKRTQFIDQSQEICSLYDDGIIFENDHASEAEAETPLPVTSHISPTLRPAIGRDSIVEGFATLPRISDVLRFSQSRGTPKPPDISPLGNRSVLSRHELEILDGYSDNIPTHSPHSSDQCLPRGGGYRSQQLIISSVESRNFLGHFAIPSCSFLPPNEQSGTLVKSHAEADLIRHFVDNLALAFELHDPARNFAAEIVQRAIGESILLESILTVSAKHLNRPRHADPFVEAQYRRQLLQYKSLVQYDRTHSIDENLLSAILCHRLSENYNGTCYNAGFRQLQPDMLSILNAQIPSSPDTKFLQDLFWSSLRQELYVAVMNETATKIDSSKIGVDWSAQLPDDYIWANRITLQLLDVIEYCFGDQNDTDTYDNLVENATAWMECKPASFTPIFIGEPAGADILPEVWLFNGFVAAGLQYYYICRLLLTAHDPKAPRIGIKQKEATQWMEDQIKDYVKIICGIADSMGTVSPAHLMACMAISLAGDRFTQPNEQEVFFNILAKTTERFGWNTTAAQRTLRDAWRWDGNIT